MNKLFQRDSKLYKYMPLIVSIVIVLALFIGNAIVSATYYSSELKALDAKKLKLQTQLEQQNADTLQFDTSVTNDVLGFDSGRVKSDDSAAEKFFKLAFTWTSYSDYVNVRNDIVDKYGLSLDSDFMKMLFPDVIIKDAAGNEYNVLDTSSANMSYDSMKSHVVGVKDGVYSYFTEVNVTAKAYDSTSVGHIVMVYDVSSDGKLDVSTMKAYTVN